jgi:hypothetical protein
LAIDSVLEYCIKLLGALLMGRLAGGYGCIAVVDGRVWG